MNKFLILFIGITLLSACSEQQFAFRKKVRADKTITQKDIHTPEKRIKNEPKIADRNVTKASFYPDSANTHTEIRHAETVRSKVRKDLLSASALKEIIPFNIVQLSPEDDSTSDFKQHKRSENTGSIFGYIALILGLLGIASLLSLVFVSSNTIGLILLFLAPALAALALISGIISVSKGDEQGLGKAGIVMGGLILLITLVMIFIAYIFIQSSIS